MSPHQEESIRQTALLAGCCELDAKLVASNARLAARVIELEDELSMWRTDDRETPRERRQRLARERMEGRALSVLLELEEAAPREWVGITQFGVAFRKHWSRFTNTNKLFHELEHPRIERQPAMPTGGGQRRGTKGRPPRSDPGHDGRPVRLRVA